MISQKLWEEFPYQSQHYTVKWHNSKGHNSVTHAYKLKVFHAHHSVHSGYTEFDNNIPNTVGRVHATSIAIRVKLQNSKDHNPAYMISVRLKIYLVHLQSVFSACTTFEVLKNCRSLGHKFILEDRTICY